MPKTFLVSDDGLNTYGLRVLTSGIKIEKFKKNPIMLYNHKRGGFGNNANEILPIGNWENLKRGTTELYADAIIDEGEKFSKKIHGKVERGVLRAASIGVRILKTSNDPKYLLPGQSHETVTSCELREISIVDIPSNSRAVVFYDSDDNVIDLSDEGNNPVPVLLLDENISNNKSSSNMEELKVIAGQLGLSDKSTLVEIQQAILKLTASNQSMTTKLADFEKVEGERKAGEIKSLLDAAVEGKKIKPEQRTNFVSLFENDFDSAKALLDSMTTSTSLKLSDVPNVKGGESTDGSEVMKFQDKTFAELRKDSPDTLKKLKADNFETFKSLYESQYGLAYKE